MKALALAFVVGLLVSAACASGPAPTSAPAELHAALEATPDPARGASLYSTCAACHGEDGGGVPDGSVPRIAGQPARVLIGQLVAFRAAERRDIRMQHFTDRRHLERAQELADVASHVALLEPRLPATVGDGTRLVAGGDLYRARCESCHGVGGHADARTGLPALAGQHAPFTERQLAEALQGKRPELDAKHRRAFSRLGPEDARALADHLSRLPPRTAPGG